MAETFDTHKAFRELTESDCFADDQAERLVALFNGAIVGNVATKADLENLEKSLKSELKLCIVSAVGIGVGLIKALDYLPPAM